MKRLIRNKNLYIISVLNDNSVLLARSIAQKDPSASIVFACGDLRPDSDVVKKAKKLSCHIIKKNIRSFSFGTYRGKSSVTKIILNNTDENVNVSDALFLSDICRDKTNAEIYVFSSSKESECLLDAIDKGGQKGIVKPLKIRRINTVRNCIYNELLHNSVFDNAVTLFNEKVISVLIVGLGRYGRELLKAILWCGQMSGYVLKINVVDIMPDAEEQFYLECPGIRQRGTQPRNGEDYYELKFYSGMNAFTESFYHMVQDLSETTMVYTALGNEQKNIEVALKLRSVFSGMQIDNGKNPTHTESDVQSPAICAIVHDIQKARLLNSNSLCNFKNQYYNIKALGAYDELYSYENVFASELESLALKAHSQWGDKNSFNNFEYYRRSSMASVIHRKYRDLLLPDDRELRAMNEHMRWCAYMRSTEGYSFGYMRDDLALRHSTLMKYSMLSSIEKEKDARMNSYNIQFKD